jgi:hypothetical protein
VRAGVIVVAFVLLLSACDGEDASLPGQTTAAAPTTTTTAGPDVPPRCIVVPPVIVRAIATELKGKGRKLAFAQAVKSTDFGVVFFVSARINGAPSTPIGTWATNNLEFGGLIFSIDPVAKRYSRWGDGSQFDRKLTLKADGARISRTCTKRVSA